LPWRVHGELQFVSRFLGFRDLAKIVRCAIWPSCFCICW
jgi:hypothetical protein